MSELAGYRLMGKTYSQQLKDSHAIEHANGWQYLRVWRFARPDDPHPVLRPSEGEWAINWECGKGGQSVTVPAWSDGSVVMQKTHWRRKYSGISRKQLAEQVRWDGDPHPNG